MLCNKILVFLIFTELIFNFLLINFFITVSANGGLSRNFLKIAVNRKMRKYYRKRYQLFARFDAGVLLDKESWYSVTPERTALHTARKCFATLLERLGGDKAAASSACVLDAFCGSGGNSIQLAK